MARSIQVVVSATNAATLLAHLDHIEGVLGVALQRGASIVPEGDIVTIQTTNDAMRIVLDALSTLNISAQAVQSNELKCIISPSHQTEVEGESNETAWEEMAVLLRQDTNIDTNFLALMFLAGAVAAIGLWMDKIHVVIGAMVIAPAFEPLLRIPFGLIAGPRRMQGGGAVSALAGYALIVLGGVTTLLILRVIDPTPTAGHELEAREWVQYWSSFTSPGVFASVLGALAGAFVVSGLRSVLTTGVMITLSLVPSITLAGMALVDGNTELAQGALARWVVDVAIVVTMSALVLGLKQKLLHRRRALG